MTIRSNIGIVRRIHGEEPKFEVAFQFDPASLRVDSSLLNANGVPAEVGREFGCWVQIGDDGSISELTVVTGALM